MLVPVLVINYIYLLKKVNHIFKTKEQNVFFSISNLVLCCFSSISNFTRY